MPTYCGVDFHPRQQSIAWCDTPDGEIHFQKPSHQSPGGVRQFYAGLPRPAVVGLEAGGYSSWFEDLLAELGHEVSRRRSH